jgi:spermidine dehydrogenase
LEKFVANMPLPEEVRRDILRLETTDQDFFRGLSSAEKKDRLSRISYTKFLLEVVKVDPRVVPLYQKRTHGLFGVGIDAVSALDCWVLFLPGFAGLKLEPGPHPRMGYTPRGYASPKEPYSFHFPDGNASIARMLVRKLIPASIPGSTAEDIVTAKADYSQLDRGGSPVRIRLSSIVVSARHSGDVSGAKEVDVAYLRNGKLFTTRGKSVVMACWNMMIPYLCPEFPEKQKEALHYGVKIPLVYTAVAIRNWESFQSLGVSRISTPGMYHHEVNLDLAVNIGDYRSPKTPDEPILVRMERMPCVPGLSERDQHRAGRGDLLSTSFETFERSIRDQLARVLGPGGFDPASDIDAITVNRWPHGYAYEYNHLFDPEWPSGQSPCEIARKPFGRIAIANSDASAAAYTDTAIDQAYRAVQELLAV